jgi:hypothetical protein
MGLVVFGQSLVEPLQTPAIILRLGLGVIGASIVTVRDLNDPPRIVAAFLNVHRYPFLTVRAVADVSVPIEGVPARRMLFMVLVLVATPRCCPQLNYTIKRRVTPPKAKIPWPDSSSPGDSRRRMYQGLAKYRQAS